MCLCLGLPSLPVPALSLLSHPLAARWLVSFLLSSSTHRPTADTTATVVDLLPSIATNSDPVTESFSTAQNSPASETTTLTSSTAAPTLAPTEAKTAPNSTPAPIIQSSTPKASTPAAQPAAQSDVAPLVDLSETPKAMPLSDSKPATPATASLEPAKATSNLPSAKANAVSQSQPEPVQSTPASDSQNKDLQIDCLAKDVFDTLGKSSEAPADSTAAPAPAKDEYDLLPSSESVLLCVCFRSPTSTTTSYCILCLFSWFWATSLSVTLFLSITMLLLQPFNELHRHG